MSSLTVPKIRTTLTTLALFACAAARAQSVGVLPAPSVAASAVDLTAAPISADNASISKVTTDDGIRGLRASLSTLYSQFGQVNAQSIDFSQVTAVSFKVRNLGAKAINLGMRLDPSKDAVQNKAPFAVGYFTIAAGQESRVVFVVRRAASGAYPMDGTPAYDGDQSCTLYDQSGLNVAPSALYRWALFSNQTASGQVEFSDMKLITGQPKSTGIVDAYGQLAAGQWPNKVGDASLTDVQNVETRDLLANPNVARFDGDASSSLGAKGTWRVGTDASGRACFVTPSGHRFWRIGMDNVQCVNSTLIQGRESMYQWLPTGLDPLTAFYETASTSQGTKRTFDFYRANLYRKYGANWYSAWVKQAQNRLSSWGVNTLGCWSDVKVAGTSIPFEGHANTGGFAVRMPAPAGAANIPDPFDAGFSGWLLSNLKSQLSASLGRPNLMGVTVDNEVYWGRTYRSDGDYELPAAILNSSANGPAKQASVNWLKAKYGTVALLNRAWGTSYASWSIDRLPTTLSAATKADLNALLGYVAGTYYQKMNAALDAVAPGTLFFGSRMGLWGTPKVVVDAAARYLDAYTFNVYDFSENVPWSYLGGLAKPVMISEFSFGAADEGTFPASVPANSMALGTQDDRAAAMRDYLDAARNTPNVIGVDWFSYTDEPVTGRFDGENLNYGVLSTVDAPHQQIVNTLRDIARNLYKG